MTLARPELLSVVALAGFLLALAPVLQWRRLHALERAFGESALARLLPSGVRRFPVVRVTCLLLATTAIGLGAAGLRPERPEPPPPAAPLDVAIVVDVSLSMGAADTQPSRVARARDVVARLSEALPAARTALVVFAAWPYTLVPPTDDPTVVRYFAGALEADLVLDRDQGTGLTAALAHARAALALRPSPGGRRVIVVLSDGAALEDRSAVLTEATAAAEDGVQIWTAGLGSERGVELETESGPVLDAAGVPVVARLDERLLMEVAAAGGGHYERVSDDGGLRALVSRLQDLSGIATDPGSAPEDATFLLALLAIPLLLVEGALDAGRGARRPRRREDA